MPYELRMFKMPQALDIRFAGIVVRTIYAYFAQNNIHLFVVLLAWPDAYKINDFGGY